MIRIAIVDDEAAERQNLQACFQHLADSLSLPVCVDEYASGNLFLSRFDCSYDLICLDIDMPGQNGIDTASAVRKKDPRVLIVFVTNMAQMAIRGYEVRAFDFLVKPVSYYPFAMKLRPALSLIEKRRAVYLTLPTNDGMRRVSTDEILYVEVRGHYLEYHTTVGFFRQKSSLKELEDRLSRCSFERCHQAYLVNLKAVTALSGDEITVGQDTLHISRAKKRAFTEALARYLGGIAR